MAALSITNMNKKQQLFWLKVITHVGSMIPLVWLYIDYYTYNLGSDEIRAAILRTGYPAIWLLVLSLVITPLNIVFGWSVLLPLRKPLGLYSFMYVSLHLAIFAVIDFGGDVPVVWDEIVNRRYALVGFASFIILVPLALTSTKWAMRKLGGKRWKWLHKGAYIAAILGVIHWIWLSKSDYTEPFTFAAVLAILLIVRFETIKKRIMTFRKERAKAKRKRQAAA
ncbi:MAG: protein-methionine-sulfoxide reductase heme-binding subunit MsrQ [Chloroflexota bacterium]